MGSPPRAGTVIATTPATMHASPAHAVGESASPRNTTPIITPMGAPRCGQQQAGISVRALGLRKSPLSAVERRVGARRVFAANSIFERKAFHARQRQIAVRTRCR